MSEKYDWTASLVGQLEFHWNVHLWPRLQGLSDGEYFWQPVPDSWPLHRGADGRWFADTATTDKQHLNREVIHHGGEVGLLRDLYFRQVG